MKRLYFSRWRDSTGFSFLELVVVICIIFILFSLSAFRYQVHLKHSQNKMILHQASAFSRMVENIHALGRAQGSRQVDLGEGLVIYTNLKDWPYATNRLDDTFKGKSSVEGCESLWLDLFTRIGQAELSEPEFGKEIFLISLVNQSTCRYKLSRKQEGLFFFDYDISTGKVAIVRPD